MKAVPPHYLTNEWRVTIVTSAPDDTAPLENKPAPICPAELFSGALVCTAFVYYACYSHGHSSSIC